MRRLTILGILALLVCALAAGLMMIRMERSSPETVPAAPETAYRMLYTRLQQDFAAMTVTLASGEAYTVESSLGFDEHGNLLGVYNSLGQPVTVVGQTDFALDSISYQMMMLTAVNLPVTATFPSLDPAACGLANPAARLEITYHTGDPIVLTIGQPAASGYACYVQMAGDSSVHLAPIDFYQVMTRPLKEHHRLPGAIGNPVSAAVQIAIVRPGERNFIATNYGGESRILPWMVDQPYVHAGSTERIQDFVKAVSAIRADGYEDTVTTAEELVTYGLDRPTRLLVAFGDGTIRDIHLGGDAGDGTVYARLDTSGDVYRVSANQLPALDQAGVDALLDRFVALISTAEVSAVAVAAGEDAWLMEITSDHDGNSYRINGQSMPVKAFSEVYAAIVGMQFDKTAEGQPAGEKYCEVRFQHVDGSISAVSYYAYDQHYVQAATGGGGQFLLRRERLENMLATLQEATK